jgi:transcriptional regulator with XRE-family HTH domain
VKGFLTYEEVPRVILETRTNRELSQRQAAYQMGVSCATLSRIENGEHPHAATLLLVARWLRIPIMILPTVEAKTP